MMAKYMSPLIVIILMTQSLSQAMERNDELWFNGAYNYANPEARQNIQEWQLNERDPELLCSMGFLVKKSQEQRLEAQLWETVDTKRCDIEQFKNALKDNVEDKIKRYGDRLKESYKMSQEEINSIKAKYCPSENKTNKIEPSYHACSTCEEVRILDASICKPIANSDKAEHVVKPGEYHKCDFIKSTGGDALLECPNCCEDVEIYVEGPCKKKCCLACFNNATITYYVEGLIVLSGNQEAHMPCCICGPQCQWEGIDKIKAAHLCQQGGKRAYEQLKVNLIDQNSNVLNCPYNCEAKFFKNDLAHLKAFNFSFSSCSACNKNICVSCAEPYGNPGHVCGRGGNSQANNTNIEYNENLKPCPNPECKQVISKNGGCSMMICGKNAEERGNQVRGCGISFCWECGMQKRSHDWIDPASKEIVIHASGFYFSAGQPGHNGRERKWWK